MARSIEGAAFAPTTPEFTAAQGYDVLGDAADLMQAVGVAQEERSAVLEAAEADLMGEITVVRSDLAEVAPIEPTREKRRFLTGGRLKVVALAMAATELLAACSDDKKPEIKDTTTAAARVANCNNVVFPKFVVSGGKEAYGASVDSKLYFPKAFFPKADGVNTQKEALQYVRDLFKQPIGGKGDRGSTAAAMAVVGKASHDGPGVAAPSVTGTFAETFTQYGQEKGQDTYEDHCKLLAETLPQVASYVAGYIKPGDVYTSIDAVRNKKGEAINLELNQATSEDELNVILLKLPKVLKGLDEFPEVAIVVNKEGEWSGRFIVKGTTIGQDGAKAFEGEEPKEGEPTYSGVPGGEEEVVGGEVPSEIAITQLDDGSIQVTNPKTGEVISNIPCGSGGCNPGDMIDIPGIGQVPVPADLPKAPAGCEDTDTCPVVTVPAPTGTTPPGTTPPVSTPTTRPTATTLPPITVTTTTGVTVTSAPPTTRPAPTTTQPAPTTTQPAPTTTRPAPTTTQPRVDYCPNIAGDQDVKSGPYVIINGKQYQIIGGICKEVDPGAGGL